MKQIEKDIETALKMIRKRNRVYDNMQEYSRIYQNTTENIKAYQPFLETTPTKALLPTASGDHQLESILAGYQEIISYDLNRLAKYFTELKFTAIKSLNREEYLHFMYQKMLDEEYFNYFKNNLPKNTLDFWTELYRRCGRIAICDELFRNLGIKYNSDYLKKVRFSKYCADNFTNTLQESNYKIIKDRLPKTKITYIDSDILELANTLDVKDKYSLINLTNIYEFINRYAQEDRAEVFADTARKLIEHLEIDGKILITYLYRSSIGDLKKYSKKSQAYVQFLALLENTPTVKNLHDTNASNKNTKSIMDKLYAMRDAQILKVLKDLSLQLEEVPMVGLGFTKENKDVALIYTKK